MTKLISAAQRQMQTIMLYFNESSILLGQGGILPAARGRGRSVAIPVLEVSFWQTIRSQKKQGRSAPLQTTTGQFLQVDKMC